MSEKVNHPEHYNISGRKECIVEMEERFGVDAVITFCKLNAYKYRYRHELKGGQEDLDKAKWYEDYMRSKWNELEVCEDAISREAVLKLFATHDGNYLYEAIRELPSVQPKRKTDWIPVSKRLPETNDDVLVYDGVDMFVAWRCIPYRNQEWDSRDDAFDRDTPIIAWMPLPEPYNAKGDGFGGK